MNEKSMTRNTVSNVMQTAELWKTEEYEELYLPQQKNKFQYYFSLEP